MNNFDQIKDKLEGFIKKFYLNELLKGAILFFAIGLLYLLITLLVENFLWLGRLGRTILFWLFVVVELALFSRFIVLPVSKLFKLTKGIDFKEASRIIGNHFPEVKDKLLNLLQLGETQTTSSLLLAGIEQKSKELSPVPFRLAIKFGKNRKYLKYAAIPISIFLLLIVFNKTNWISDSYERVVNYKVAYEPPAPFQFFLVNNSLKAYESKDYRLEIRVSGDVVPESVMITYNEESYFLKSVGTGEFEYTFVKPKETLEFVLEGNNVRSIPYTLAVVPVPTLIDFKMSLDYPGYTGKKDEVIKSSGNASVPEGTSIKWVVNTKNTDKVQFISKDSVFEMKRDGATFVKEKVVSNSIDYSITTSNDNISNYDNLSFGINVIKDQYPELNLSSEKDSIDNQSLYFFGRISDDYGLSKLRLVYYKDDDVTSKSYHNIPVKGSNFDEFIYVFPSKLDLEAGSAYEFYFEVFDNDVFHGYKSTKSEVFEFRKLTKDELDNKLLQKQNEAISGLNESLDKFKKQEEELKSISDLQKEKKELDFNDKRKLKDFLNRQKQQEKMMQDFSKQLKENLNQLDKKEEEEPFKDALKERLERNEEKLRKNEKLLEEMEKFSEKIKKEELTQKLEELGKENKNIKRNLEQLLELTKRYYVIEKHEKLAKALEDLSKEQEELSEKDENENTQEKQDKISEKFKEFQKEMEELRKDNENLKKPMSLDQDKNDEKEINEEQQKASDNLEKKSTEEAKKNQKSAAQKMSKMSKKMGMQMEMSGQQQQAEDMEMLRQVLDNLVDFSFEQEDLMNGFKKVDKNNPSYSQKLKRQSVLRENFIHIDDSLYSLALRTPQITEDVTKKLTDIEFNIDKSLERLAENQIAQGSSNQQYTITGANDLAYLLSRSLDQMQNSMSASGSGKSGSGKNEFQLPDIIKKQEELNGKMKDGAKKGDKPGEKEGGQKEGEKGGEGKKGKEGGDKGNKNGDGKSGKDGQGKDGNNDGKQGEGNGKEDINGQEYNEDINGELYNIYKQQQQLRNALEDRIKKEGIKDGIGSNLLRKMEEVEQELLEKGFNDGTLSKMLNLKHELLKLEEATLKQGEEEKRESETNKDEFENSINEQLNRAKQYFNTTEILNRQVLPLRQNYKIKVQEYFRKDND